MKPHGVLILFALILTLVHRPSKAAIVNAGNDTALCSCTGDYLLSGSPSGGIYTGIGVYQNNNEYYFKTYSLSPGKYEIIYTVLINGLPFTDTLYITLNGLLPVDAGFDRVICTNYGPYYILKGSPAGGTWGIIQGDKQFLKGDTFFIPKTDTIDYSLFYKVVSSDGCPSYDTISIDIIAFGVEAGSDFAVCKGTIVKLWYSGIPQNGVWYSKQFQIGRDSNLIITENINPGTYTLFYEYRRNQCSGIDSLLLTITPVPEAHAGNDTVICGSNDTLRLKGYPEGGTWTGPNVYASKEVLLQSLKTGKYTYVYSNIVNACEATDTMVLTIDDPFPDFTSSASMGAGPLTVSFHNRSKQAVSYAWDFGDPVSGALNYSSLENPQHTFSAIGNYVVSLRVYSSIGCISDTSMVCVIHANGVGDIRLAPSGIQLYPNPATTQLFIQCALEAGKPYVVFDYTGRVVRSGTIPEGMFNIDVEDLPEAIYWIKINQQLVRFVKR